jgi:hypothetical protein
MEPTQQLTRSACGESWAALNTKWERRALLAAEWLRGERVVADIGCGLMTLEGLLPKSSTYVPMDVVRRDARTIILDLNKDRIPVVACDAAVLLGVLEYVDNLRAVLEQLRQFPKTLLSYNHISFNDLLWTAGLRPKRVTWRNRHTKTSLRRLMRSSGLQIVRERMIRVGEKLYEVCPTLGQANTAP